MLPSEQGQYNGYTGYQVCTIGNLSVVHIHYLADNANANPSSSSTAIPFAIFIFCFDETRKALMRATSKERTDPMSRQTIREMGWIERNFAY